jgi:glucose/mannose-6-phosphate isomerase
MILDDPARLAAVDRHGAAAVLAAFAAQCREALTLASSLAHRLDRPRLVIVAAMGGSAAGGDLLAACAADLLDVPVLVHRGYGLPALAGGKDLVIASSYSGETVEVLSAAEEALARGCPLAVVTSGGRLQSFATQRGVAHITLPPGLMPRMALGYLLFPLFGILRAADLTVTRDADVDKTMARLDELARELAPACPATDNEAKRLALAIGDRLPVIYGGPTTSAAAYRWKTDLEENAKTFAVAGAVPEMNHNEIEAWRRPQTRDFQLVLLRDHDEPAEMARRFTLLQDLVGAAAGGVSTAWSRGVGPLSRLLPLIYLGQWTSYYLAVLRGTDPWVVPTLDALKMRLRSP